MEQLGRKPVSIWNAKAADSSLTICATILAPSTFSSRYTASISQTSSKNHIIATSSSAAAAAALYNVFLPETMWFYELPYSKVNEWMNRIKTILMFSL